MREENKWKLIPSMETPRYWFGATAIGENIYVAGGCNNQYKSLSSVEVYDSKINKCPSLLDMTNKRHRCTVTSVNGKVYVIGGNDGYGSFSSSEMFDPATNKWTVL